jgi:hypothetical protein
VNHRKVTEEERRIREATEFFEELSRLMDKRLFRMRQWHISIIGTYPDEVVDQRLSEYRDVLYEWNDSVNRHLAMLEIYFSKELRHEFDNDVGDNFVRAGVALEKLFGSHGTPQNESKSVKNQLADLGDKVYGFNLNLLQEIKEMRSLSIRGILLTKS